MASRMLTVQVEDDVEALITLAAQKDGHSVGGHLRHLAMLDLQEKKLVDENFKPLVEIPQISRRRGRGRKASEVVGAAG